MDQDMWVASRSWEQPPAVQPARKWRHQSDNDEELDSANNLNEQGNNSPLEPPEKKSALRHLDFSLMRPILDSWPTELSDNKSVLFCAAKFVVVGYGSKKNYKWSPTYNGSTSSFPTLWWYKNDMHSVETVLWILTFNLCWASDMKYNALHDAGQWQ